FDITSEGKGSNTSIPHSLRRKTMRGIVKMFVLGTLGLAVLSASIGSWALPRRSTLAGGECNCQCVVDGGAGHSGGLGLITGLPTSFGICSVYNTKTCNLADPETGGIRSGRTGNCCQVQDNGTCRDSVSGAI